MRPRDVERIIEYEWENRRALPSARAEVQELENDEDEWEPERIARAKQAAVQAELHRISEDNTKIERHERQLRLELEQAITAAGEAGWRSMFYTGPSHEVDLRSLAIYPYQQWMLARSDYVRTGDGKYLEAMLKVVDFNNPPEASVARLPKPTSAKKRSVMSPAQVWRAVKPKTPSGKALGGAFLVVASVYAVVAIAIGLLILL